VVKPLSEARLPPERFLGQMDGQVGRVVPSRGRVPPPGLRGEGPATRLACSAPFGAPSLFSMSVWVSRAAAEPVSTPAEHPAGASLPPPGRGILCLTDQPKQR